MTKYPLTSTIITSSVYKKGFFLALNIHRYRKFHSVIYMLTLICLDIDITFLRTYRK